MNRDTARPAIQPDDLRCLQLANNLYLRFARFQLPTPNLASFNIQEPCNRFTYIY